MAWSAVQYLKFEAERTRPVRDLLSAVPTKHAQAVIDIGCGPANSTEVLAACYPNAAVSGLDSDADMIAAARKRMPDARFTLGALDDWAPHETYDVILSNAALHWVPNHATLFPKLVAALNPGGSLAIQMPNNMQQSSHQALLAIAALPKWAHKLTPEMAGRTPIAEPRWYFDLLQRHCSAINIWQTTYNHRLKDGVEGIVEWFAGSALRPFLATLDDAEKVEFLSDYRTAITRAYPLLADGAALLPFPRLFIVATR